MPLQIRQTLRQTQQLVMTPQLQQAIKLLQYNHLEMVNAVEHEMRENPLLEPVAEDEPLVEQERENRNDLKSLEESVKEPEHGDKDALNVDWGAYLETYGGDRAPVDRSANERSPLDNVAARGDNLFHYLLQQLRLSKLNDADRRIALELIGNIDEKGYLDVGLEQIAEAGSTDVSHVERVLGEVQKFDPPGVAARTLQECLTLQTEADPQSDLVAVRILKEAFDLFQKGSLDKVARKLKVSLDRVKTAARFIASLNPKPGSLYGNSDTVYVVPDLYVLKIGNDYTVVLNDDGLPRLRISSFYQRQLQTRSAHGATRDYIQEKMRGAMWLIKSIHQRQRTIYKVTRSIVKFQREFFDKGIDYLKPLILKDVADDIEMHESTISRVTTNKYVHTPRGIFELKYFFNSGLPQGGDSIASESVKNQIARIVKQEDPKKPVSDKQIVEQLAGTGIDIARRTVAKYRELLGIPPSSKRKKKF
ncbi:MAG: RNA polymerase factor sigma-54 [Thermodesulfobacteriota bacterium]